MWIARFHSSTTPKFQPEANRYSSARVDGVGGPIRFVSLPSFPHAPSLTCVALAEHPQRGIARACASSRRRFAVESDGNEQSQSDRSHISTHSEGSSHETDIQSEPPEAPQQARLPFTHVEPQRTEGPCPPSREGSPPPVGQRRHEALGTGLDRRAPSRRRHRARRPS